MSTDISTFLGSPAAEELNDQARLAVKNFRALQPTLNAYVRMRTGRRDTRIEMSVKDNGSTDGKRIFYRPPLALGDSSPHQRKLCNKRDEKMQHLCSACGVREDVLVTIYHEIGHICENSFAETSDNDKRELLSKALEQHHSRYAKRVEARVKAAPPYARRSYIGLASLINEFLPLLVNALEDARVNRELFKARKGTKKMFDASITKIFTEGVEQNQNGEIVVIPWTEYPQNMQVIIGTFCKASNYDYQDWFIPPVVEALNDEVLTRLIRQMDTIRSAGGVYHLSFSVLSRLRELGFCISPLDPDQEQDEIEEQGEDEAGQEGDGDQSSDSGGESSDSGDSDSDSHDDGSSESSGSSDTSDEKMEDDSGYPSAMDSSEENGDRSNDDRSTDSSSEEEKEEDTTSEANSDPSDDEGDSVGEGDVEGEEVDSRNSDGDGSEPSPASRAGSDLDEGDYQDGTGEERSSDNDSGEDSLRSPEGDDSDSKASDDQGDAIDRGESESNSSSDSEDNGLEPSDEVIDPGADKGLGGIEVIRDEEPDYPEMGGPEEVEEKLKVWGHHEDPPLTIHEKVVKEREDNALERAIIQGWYFETPSNNIAGVHERYYDSDDNDESSAWAKDKWIHTGYSRTALGVEGDFDPPETILGPALLQMRRVFTDNAKGSEVRNLKAGRINTRALAKRAPINDPRIMQKRKAPGKKKYFVLIGVDISGSTIGKNIALEKRAVTAQAELCSRMGIDFAIYAHTGSYERVYSGDMYLDIYHIKDRTEPWDSHTRERLHEIGPESANIDGHTLEYYRKRLDESDATDKIIMYYTDGKMPAENYDEELEILQRELQICRQKRYTVMGVGIRTDSPVRHGLDTVQVDGDEDIYKVVKHLEKRLLITGGR